MVKKYLLDTGILIFMYQGDPSVKSIMDNIDITECEIGSVVTAEFFQGLYRKTNLKAEREWYLNLIEIGEMNVIDFNEESAKKYAEIQVKNLKKGTPRPVFDLMIAAICLVNNLTLITKNIKDFEMIEGLKIYKEK